MDTVSIPININTDLKDIDDTIEYLFEKLSEDRFLSVTKEFKQTECIVNDVSITFEYTLRNQYEIDMSVIDYINNFEITNIDAKTNKQTDIIKFKVSSIKVDEQNNYIVLMIDYNLNVNQIGVNQK